MMGLFLLHIHTYMHADFFCWNVYTVLSLFYFFYYPLADQTVGHPGLCTGVVFHRKCPSTVVCSRINNLDNQRVDLVKLPIINALVHTNY